MPLDEVQTTFVALLGEIGWAERQTIGETMIAANATLATSSQQWLAAILAQPLTPAQALNKAVFLQGGGLTSTSTGSAIVSTGASI